MRKKIIISFFILVSLILFSCQFLNSTLGGEEEDYNSKITSVKFNTPSHLLKSGEQTAYIEIYESEHIPLLLNPSSYQGKVNVSWEYDKDFIDVKVDNFGAVITPKKEGSTYLKASCNGIVAHLQLQIIPNTNGRVENPYIYSNFSVVELKPNDTTTINASLYGGSVAQMEMFEWEIKDPSVANITYSRNNCVIQALKPGSTQITCTHPESKYPYTFVVYVFTDAMKETYITTDYNILTINKNETPSRTISVNLVNPLNAAYNNGFVWEYGDEESKEIIQLNANLESAEIIPLKNGLAKIKVTHENAKYPLEILVRVSTVVQNTYIGLSESNLIIKGSDTTHTVYATVENYNGHADHNKFIWEVPDNASDYIDYYYSGNSFSVTGKRNGSIKVNVRHELSETSRSLLIVLQEQIGSAIDSSMYITTDQNYVQTKVGAEPTAINIRLVGGIEGVDNIGDETSNFTWWIKGGNNNGIAQIETVTGVVKDLTTRSAVTSGNSASGQLVITPLKEGVLDIVVSHPRCLYDAEIKLKVFAESVLVNPLTISTDDSLIKLINGQSKQITARLRNHTAGQENDIEWTSSNNSNVTVSPSKGEITQITACGTGSTQTYITAHLEGALADKKILVLAAATQADLNAMKGMYADSTYLRIAANEVKELSVHTFGLSASDRITWRTNSDSIAIVEADGESDNASKAKVTGIAEGKCKIIASISGAEDVEFDVTVLKAGQSSEVYDENAGYLTTNLNAVVIEAAEQSKNLSVTGINIEDSDMRLFTNWTMSDVDPVDGDPVFDIAGSPGANVTLTANRPGKSKIKVTNKLAENSLTINAKCGELYEWSDDYIVYIETENDVVNIINGATTTIGCSLVNTTSTGSFSWSITKGDDIIDIVGLTSGTCNISAKQAGQAIIKVSNNLAGENTKEILVNVANSEQELKGYKYLSTEQNVVTVGQQSNTSVTVEIKNTDANVIAGYSWRSINTQVADVVGSGNVASIYGKQIGTTKIIVENYDQCDYPLEIIVNVVDPVAAAQDPYISCNSIVTCTVGDNVATIAAELVGGTASDNTNFSWSIVDQNIATLYANNESAQIKALREGVTQVIISHPKANVDRTILVICEPKVTTKCYINVTESIIKMSPSDGARTIRATLVNGEADDVYEFKWWADSYDKINMNYTGDSCLIEPLSSGVVTIHCSHPKAASQKDIVLYISEYSDFAFSQNYVELETGTDMFLDMEVPATGVDCEIAYKSSNPAVCTVFGNSSVVTLHPGTVPEGQTSTTCTITATLQTKGGVKQGEAELLVSVTRKDETKPYIGLSANEPTIITLNKGGKKNISAQLFGTGIVDTNSAQLEWTINGADKTIAFTSSKTTGKDVQIEALNPGKTTMTIRHDEAKNPLTLYVIVAGVSEPTVTLNYTELPIYIGEDTQTLLATVQNDTGEELQWEIVNDIDGTDQQDFFSFSASGKKASIFAKKVGEATVRCTIPSNQSTATCKIKILDPPRIAFFVYDDESSDTRQKRYIDSLHMYPGEMKILHYETTPPKDNIKELYRSDNSYFNINPLGYVTSYEDPLTGDTYEYPEAIGTIVVSGTTKEGTANLRATTDSEQMDTISVVNSYNYLFTTNKSIINSTPKDVDENNSILYVDYQIRPATSKIYVTDLTTNLEQSVNLQMEDGSYAEKREENGRNVWVIETHQTTDETSSTGIVTGQLKFKITGEVNAKLSLEAVNENVISSGTTQATPQKFGTQSLNLQVYYPRHTFIPTIKQVIPYINYTAYGKTEKNATGKFDAESNSFFIGDGEYISGTIGVDETNQPLSNVKINSVKFTKKNTSKLDTITSNTGKRQDEWMQNTETTGQTNTGSFYFFHEQDYCGQIGYTDSSGARKTKASRFYRLTNTNDADIEHQNDTIRERSYVGNLTVHYYNVALGKEDTYSFPVYVLVRNNPCSTNEKYNN